MEEAEEKLKPKNRMRGIQREAWLIRKVAHFDGNMVHGTST